MFPAPDSNSFTVPFSDQFSLIYSKLLDDADIDYNSSPNPYSPFSFFDQSFTHPTFMLSDHDDQQQLELQNSLMAPDHEEQPIVVTPFEDFTNMADGTRSNDGASMRGYVTNEKYHHSGLAGDHLSNGISPHAVGKNMSQDKVRRNGKDRHSKINTAQGPRDRRMRLSLDVARRFFGLQDMLGFDKASKTVDWLLSMSESEINKAYSKKYDGNTTATTKSDSFGACECYEEESEVVNKEDHVSHSRATDTDKVDKKSGSTKNKKTRKAPVSLHRGFNSLSKESREKARARARERTEEKKMICSNSQNHSMRDNNVHHFSNMDQNLITDQDESLANTLYWNPSSTILSNQQQQSNETSQQLQFRDAQVYARPWETYN